MCLFFLRVLNCLMLFMYYIVPVILLVFDGKIPCNFFVVIYVSNFVVNMQISAVNVRDCYQVKWVLTSALCHRNASILPFPGVSIVCPVCVYRYVVHKKERSV